jgi:hypothetical protein
MCSLHLLGPHFHPRIMGILTGAPIRTFLASPMTYFMMDAALGSGAVYEHDLDGTTEPYCPQP